MPVDRRPNSESLRTGDASAVPAPAIDGCIACRLTVGGAEGRWVGAGAGGGAGGASLGGNSTVAALAEIVGCAGSPTTVGFGGGGAGGSNVLTDGAAGATRVRIGAVRGGGGGGKVAVAETGEERTVFVSTRGTGPLGRAFVAEASIQALSLAISSSSRLASAEPLPGMPALLQNSTSSLLSSFKSFASA